MAPDLTAYEAVTTCLEKAEREAGLRGLHPGTGAELSDPGNAEAAVLRWVEEYQAQRLLMHLLLLDAIDAVWGGGRLEFRLADTVPVALRERIERAGNAPDDGSGPAGA